MYNFATNSFELFLLSNVAYFVPQYYILRGAGLWNIIPLCIFLFVTIVLYYSSSKYYIKGKYNFVIPLNIFWLILCKISYLTFFSYNLSTVMINIPFFSVANMYIWVIFIYFYIFTMIYKYNDDYSKMFSSGLIPTSYKKLKKYAYSNFFISVFTVSLSLWMHYFSDMPLSNPKDVDMITIDYLLYPTFIIINITILIFSLVSYFDIKKIQSNELTNKKTVKIFALQICGILFSITSFFIINFLCFKK